MTAVPVLVGPNISSQAEKARNKIKKIAKCKKTNKNARRTDVCRSIAHRPFRRNLTRFVGEIFSFRKIAGRRCGEGPLSSIGESDWGVCEVFAFLHQKFIAKKGAVLEVIFHPEN